MVAYDQHLRHQPIPVVLDGTAKGLDLRRHVPVGRRDIAEAGQAADLTSGIGQRGGGRFGRAEHGLFAGGQNRLAGEIVDTSERRQARGRDRRRAVALTRAAGPGAKAASGCSQGNPDGEQRDDGQCAIRH